jgi:hypothetical protein
MSHPILAPVKVFHLSGYGLAELASLVVMQVFQGIPKADADPLIRVFGAAQKLALSQALDIARGSHSFVIVPFILPPCSGPELTPDHPYIHPFTS